MEFLPPLAKRLLEQPTVAMLSGTRAALEQWLYTLISLSSASSVDCREMPIAVAVGTREASIITCH